MNLVKNDASVRFHPVFRVYKITINVLEQPSNEPSIQAYVNSKKEGRDGGTLENNRNLIIQELLWASKLTQKFDYG